MSESSSDPRVSVVIPLYNKADHIVDVIQSVLAQSFTDYEIIIVNDGSTDSSEAAIEPFRDKIRYFKQDNSGPSVARNKGIELARGEYIAFLDADDEWLPAKLATQVKFMDEHPEIMWCTTNGGMFRADAADADRTLFAQDRAESEYLIVDDWFVESLGKNVTATPGVMVRSELLETVGVFDPGVPAGQDMDLWIRIALSYPQIGLILRPLIRIRYHLPGCVSLSGEKKYKSMLAYFRKHAAQLADGSTASDSFRSYLKCKLMDNAKRLLPLGMSSLSRDYLRTIPAELRDMKWRLVFLASWLPAILFRCVLAIRLKLADRKARTARTAQAKAT